MPPVNPIRVLVNATKAILEKSAKINVLPDFMVPVVWRCAVVRMAALVIMYPANVFVRPAILDHCKCVCEFKGFF